MHLPLLTLRGRLLQEQLARAGDHDGLQSQQDLRDFEALLQLREPC